MRDSLTGARAQAAITEEIARLAPLVEEGGFIPMPDRRVPPDVPLSNYLHYCRTARQVWGHDANLPVMQAEAAPAAAGQSRILGRSCRTAFNSDLWTSI